MFKFPFYLLGKFDVHFGIDLVGIHVAYFFNMIGGRIFLGLPLEKKVILGALISFAGMGLITWNELQSSELERYPYSFWGFMLSLAGTVSASAGNLVSAKNRILGLPIISNTAFGMLYGAIFTLIFCLSQNFSFSMDINTSFALSFFYLTVFGTVISFISYLKLIQIVGPSKAAFTSVASPIIALTVSTLFESMGWSWQLAVGVILCLLGNVVALASNFRRLS